MLEVFADSIVACTPAINENINEESLYVLLKAYQCLPLQKAAFFMLNHLYSTYIPTVRFKIDTDLEAKQLEI